MRTLAITFILTLTSFSAFAQSYTHKIRTTEEVLLVKGEVAEIKKPKVIPDKINRKKIINAGFEISLSVNDPEGFMTAIGDNVINCELIVKALDKNGGELSGIFLQEKYDLAINAGQHKNVLQKDFTRKLQRLIEQESDVDAISVTVNEETASDVSGMISLTAKYYVEYAYAVSLDEEFYLSAPEKLKVNLYSGTRNIDFVWEHTYPFSAYELQIAHTESVSPEEARAGIQIEVDWENALTILVPVQATNAKNQMYSVKQLNDYKLISGSGIYVWRVRAIGGYEEGGLANKQNYGAWPDYSGNRITTSTATEKTYWFVFADPDEDINTIRSKVYTEDLKVKEINTYADGLQNVKQTQVNIPSNNTTIVTQTEQDFSGRNALTTMPVPLRYETTTYQEKLLKNASGKLYTAENFDTGEGIPEAALETGAFSYYLDNPDKRIGNTEGYPFSRTTYYNDGLGRVKEQSAPGSNFAMKEDGSGHLIRYYYSTATEKELVRIFGSEAPNPDNVSKTIVVDQNNIATTTYKTLDGKVIATCLNLSDGETTGLLPIDSQSEDASYTTKEVAKTNVRTDYGFYSSKRIVLSQPVDLQVEYKITDAAVKALCASFEASCQYTVVISILDLESKETVFRYPENGGVKVSKDNQIKQTASLVPGSYLVEKKLFFDNSTIDEEKIRLQLNTQIKTLYDIIEFWMLKVNCNGLGDDYYACLNLFRELADNPDEAGEGLSSLVNKMQEQGIDLDFIFTESDVKWNNFVKMYEDDDNADLRNGYKLSFFRTSEDGEPKEITDLVSLNNVPDYLYLETGSCCNMWAPAKFIPTFDFTREPEILPDGSIYPDFEAYASAFMDGCAGMIDENGQSREVYEFMDGWPKGTFNLMVYHMLTDQYERKNPIIEKRKEEEKQDEPPTGEEEEGEPQTDECGNPVEESCEDGSCYDMRTLFKCWQGVLTVLKDELGCGTVDMEYGIDEEDKEKPSKQVDEENDGDKAEQDDHYNDNFKMKGIIGWFAKRRAKKKISEAMRKLEMPDVQVKVEDENKETTYHLVKEFLNCSGYQFAKILTPFDPYPLSGTYTDDEGINFEIKDRYSVDGVYTGTQLGTNVPVLPNLGSFEDYLYNYKKTGGHDYPYIPIGDWEPMKKRINEEGELEDTDEPLFPNIKNPIYAFKYFQYQQHGSHTHAQLEQMTCFDDPNDCFKVDEEGNLVLEYDLETGKISWMPCCAPNLKQAGNPEEVPNNFCVKDYDYPLVDELAEAQITNDLRFGSSGDNTTGDDNFRWVVKDFLGEGRLKCPYTHEVWSSGQRYAFYKQLEVYTWVEPEEEEVEEVYKETCVSSLPDPEGQNPVWYQKGGSGQFLRKEFIEQVLNEDPESDLYKKVEPSDYFYPGTEEEENRPQSVSQLELEMVSLINQCNNACEEKRDQVKTDVISVLTESGYIIGGCISEETPQNIPMEDVDAMVDELIEQCHSQCKVTTFACEEIGHARYPHESKIKPGATYGDDLDETTYVRLHLGISGDNVCNQPELKAKGFSDCQIGLIPLHNFVPGGEIKAREYLLEGEYQDISTYSWYEHTLIKQAREWQMKISIDPAPGKDGEREFSSDGSSESTFLKRADYETPPEIPDGDNPEDTQEEIHSPARPLILELPKE